MTLREYAVTGIRDRLNRLVQEVARVSKDHDAEAVHDLRVSSRRLGQALRALESVFPRKTAKQVRRELRSMMDLTAEVRNRDIALHLFEAAGVQPDTDVCARLRQERSASMQRLIELMEEWRTRRFDRPWRPLLELPKPVSREESI